MRAWRIPRLSRSGPSGTTITRSSGKARGTWCSIDPSPTSNCVTATSCPSAASCSNAPCSRSAVEWIRRSKTRKTGICGCGTQSHAGPFAHIEKTTALYRVPMVHRQVGARQETLERYYDDCQGKAPGTGHIPERRTDRAASTSNWSRNTPTPWEYRPAPCSSCAARRTARPDIPLVRAVGTAAGPEDVLGNRTINGERARASSGQWCARHSTLLTGASLTMAHRTWHEGCPDRCHDQQIAPGCASPGTTDPGMHGAGIAEDRWRPSVRECPGRSPCPKQCESGRIPIRPGLKGPVRIQAPDRALPGPVPAAPYAVLPGFPSVNIAV